MARDAARSPDPRAGHAIREAARSRRPCDPPAEWAVVSRRVDAAGGAHAVAAYACSRHRAEVLDLIARRTATPIADGCDAPCGCRADGPCRECLRPTCALCLIPLDGRCIDCWAGVDRTGEAGYGGRWRP